MTGDMGDHTLSGQTAGNRQNWRQLILNPFKNDLFEMCGECVQTIFTFKGLDVTGVKNGITGTLRPGLRSSEHNSKLNAKPTGSVQSLKKSHIFAARGRDMKTETHVG